MTKASQKQKINRKIIKIDEELCDGCGNCVVSCAEGALAIIDGKARVINEVFCDGLGACMGECPQGALTIEERVSYAFDEEAVEKHLESLKEQEQVQKEVNHSHAHKCSCPSSAPRVYDNAWTDTEISGEIPSALRQWPTKIELVSPTAPYFNTKELVIVSDCSPVAYGDFHRKILKGRPIVTLCPMLGLGEAELDKLEQILIANPIEHIEVILMEVGCCQKLKLFLDPIIAKVGRPITVVEKIISVDGKILREGNI